MVWKRAIYAITRVDDGIKVIRKGQVTPVLSGPLFSCQ